MKLLTCATTLIALLCATKADSSETQQGLLRATITSKVGFKSCSAAEALVGIETHWKPCDETYHLLGEERIVSCSVVKSRVLQCK